MYIYTYIYIHIYIFVYMYIYVCTHMFTRANSGVADTSAHDDGGNRWNF